MFKQNLLFLILEVKWQLAWAPVCAMFACLVGEPDAADSVRSVLLRGALKEYF
jgi:hypothetical protein